MALLLKQELENLISQNGFIPISVLYFDISKTIIIEDSSISNFLTLSREYSEKNIFYYYDYFEIEDYLIAEEQYESNIPQLKSAVRKHNQKILGLDFSRPSNLYVFILINGTFLAVLINDDWISELEIFESEFQADIIETDFKEKNAAIIIQNQKEKEILKNELKERLFKEEMFKFQKNQDLRYRYLIDLINNREEYAKFKELLQPYGISRIGNVKLFMDETWQVYQEMLKKK